MRIWRCILFDQITTNARQSFLKRKYGTENWLLFFVRNIWEIYAVCATESHTELDLKMCQFLPSDFRSDGKKWRKRNEISAVCHSANSIWMKKKMKTTSIFRIHLSKWALPHYFIYCYSILSIVFILSISWVLFGPIEFQYSIFNIHFRCSIKIYDLKSECHFLSFWRKTKAQAILYSCIASSQ